MKIMMMLTAAMIVATSAMPAMAAPCRDAKGRFTKCPTAPATTTRCKDAKGRFAKCSAPGAKPA